jgi:hypothetical protein
MACSTGVRARSLRGFCRLKPLPVAVPDHRPRPQAQPPGRDTKHTRHWITSQPASCIPIAVAPLITANSNGQDSKSLCHGQLYQLQYLIAHSR